MGSLTFDANGNIQGTTYAGGAKGNSTGLETAAFPLATAPTAADYSATPPLTAS